MGEVTVEELRRFTEGMPVGIFEGISDEQLEKIARATRRTVFAEDEVIIEDGSDGDKMYLLLSGTVRVTKALAWLAEDRFVQVDKEIIELPAEWNPYFGELALFDSAAVRTATVFGSGGGGELGAIQTDDFLALVEDDHDLGYCMLRNVLVKTSGTIRNANENVLNLAAGMQFVARADLVDGSGLGAVMEGGDAYVAEFIQETVEEVARLRTRVASFSQYYTAGGTLSAHSPSYVARLADDTIYTALASGEFCYVLTARQMGKSSLMARTAQRLREAGAAVVMIDLAAIGQNLTVEQWYDGLLARIGDSLDLEDELEEFWEEHDELGPLNRWVETIRRVVLSHRQEQIVIFVDEVDAVRSLPFSTDEFFAAIRACLNLRVEHTEFERLTFCLLGAAAPTDLVRDRHMTPFNVSRPIELTDFTLSECAPLAAGLGYEPDFAGRLIERVYHWTSGHPYLTQSLCRAVAEQTSVTSVDEVDQLCGELFLSNRAAEQDSNLTTVRDRLLRDPQHSGPRLRDLLSLYGEVLAGTAPQFDGSDSSGTLLQLAGIAKTEDGRLSMRNRIYSQVFDENWIRQSASGRRR